jgi:hypothetical protein
MLFDNWNHVIQYNIEKGYYVMNTSDLVPSYNGIDIQFPDLESQVLMISSSYKFNKNYSMRAIQSQTEIQAKSAGSFMPGLGLNLYSLSGADRYRNENGEDIYRDSYNDYTGINVALNIGYYYTFVIKKQWFANGFAIPSVGIDFYGTRTHDSGSSEWRRYNEMYGALIYGFGGGYNGAKLFFGADFRNRLTSENFNTSKIRILPTQNQFSVYFGYRFRAPKPISKPVDLIEEKVPILKK